MLSPLRFPSHSSPATPPSPSPTQLSRPHASSYFRSMPPRAGIRNITRTVTYVSMARLSSNITSATRRMLSPSPPRGNAKENATVWSPANAILITPRKPLGPFKATLPKARLTPDTPRKGSQHAADVAYSLPSPMSPPTRRMRPSSMRLSHLPIPPFEISPPPRRTNPASPTKGNYVVTPPSSKYATPLSAAYLAYPATPTTGRGIQQPRSSPRSPLSTRSSKIGPDNIKNQCNEEGTLLTAFRSVTSSFSLSSSGSFSSIDIGLDTPLSSTVLQLYVAGRDVPAVFSTTSPLVQMIQQAREEQSPSKGQHTIGVQPVTDVPSLRVAQTTRAPAIELQVAQIEKWQEELPSCIGARRSPSIGAQPQSDRHHDATHSSESESASGHTLVRRRPTRQRNERADRPQSAPPVSLQPSADGISTPAGKSLPLMRTRSILSRLTGRVAPPSATNISVPSGTGSGGGLDRSNITGKRGTSYLLRMCNLKLIFTT